jgi:hypothetical protein
VGRTDAFCNVYANLNEDKKNAKTKNKKNRFKKSKSFSHRKIPTKTFPNIAFAVKGGLINKKPEKKANGF